jgi:tRNA(adenine34) deaminase
VKLRCAETAISAATEDSAPAFAASRAIADREPALAPLDDAQRGGAEPRAAEAVGALITDERIDARHRALVHGVASDRETISDRDFVFMNLALEEARRAEALDEVPIGAVIVADGRVIARAHNRTRMQRDPTAHAEILAIRAACRELRAARIPGVTLFTTVEPCFMCAGALSHARVERVVWGVRDPKFGGCASLGEVLSDPRLNHRVSITEGVRAAEARELLQEFFRKKRGTAD